jgi:site-specific DNA-methyltransferase (adenine-specific)
VEGNLLYYGDNLDVMRKHVESSTVDLVYLDPPFNSNASYNVLFAEQDGSRAAGQILAFEDTWRWDQAAAAAYQEGVEMGGAVSLALQAFRTFLGDNDVLAYLSMMAPRLVELRRVLKPTGSIYLHCDPTAGHYLKLLMDAVFSPKNFRNEIIWRRTGSNSAAKRFGPLHQTILYYAMGPGTPYYPQKQPYTVGYVKDFFTEEDPRGRYRSVLLTGPGTRKGESGQKWRLYNPTSSGRHWQPASYIYEKYRAVTGEDLAQWPLLERLDKLDEAGLIHWAKKIGGGVPNYKYYLADAPGVLTQDIWAYQPGTEGCVYKNPDEGIDQDVKWLSTKDQERLGYPTQKPEGVLERIIKSSSKEGDLVLDPFCGCGTTIAVAQKLNRRWTGIDITQAAISLIKVRLEHAYQGKANYETRGEPTTVEDAAKLAQDDPYQFQFWALSLVGAYSAHDAKKGADKGIDGRLYFHDEGPVGKTKQVIISAKSGHVGVGFLHELRGVIEREKAEIGVLLTFNPPTKPMRAEAAGAGYYTSPWGNHPRLQVLTVGELLEGQTIDYPHVTGSNVTHRRAPRVYEPTPENLDLFDKVAEAGPDEPYRESDSN